MNLNVHLATVFVGHNTVSIHTLRLATHGWCVGAATLLLWRFSDLCRLGVYAAEFSFHCSKNMELATGAMIFLAILLALFNRPKASVCAMLDEEVGGLICIVSHIYGIKTRFG